MDLRQLQHFVAVAEEGQFTRAAERVHVVQSALSTSIRALEENLGVRLFDRTTRHVRLTASGRLFYEHALIVLGAIANARASLLAVKAMERGSLTLGAAPGVPALLQLASMLAEFHALHPGIAIRLSEGNPRYLLQRLDDGDLDIVFLVAPPPPPPAGICTHLVVSGTLVLACSPNHPLAGRSDVAIADLMKETFVELERGFGTRRLVDRAFAATGLERQIGFEVGDPDTAFDLVARGLGVALAPQFLFESRSNDLGFAQLIGPHLEWGLVAARHDEVDNPAVAVFVSLLPALSAPA